MSSEGGPVATKEKPILLYAHEVRRLLETGRVDVWRPVEPQPPMGINELHGGELSKRAPYTLEDNETGIIIGMGFLDDDDRPYICPHPPDSTAWVRETWAPYDTDGVSKVAVVYRASYDESCDGSAEAQGAVKWFDAPTCEFVAKFRDTIARFEVEGERWHSSATMPRWVSRLGVDVMTATAQMVKSISEEELAAAGYPLEPIDETAALTARSYGMSPSLYQFACWWERRFGAGNFAANPWAWKTTLTIQEAVNGQPA